MGEFNSDDHYIYYCGQESLRRTGVAIMVNKRVRNAVLGYNLKNDRIISVHFQDKPFNIMVIQVYAPTSNAEEAEVKWSVFSVPFCSESASWVNVGLGLSYGPNLSFRFAVPVSGHEERKGVGWRYNC